VVCLGELVNAREVAQHAGSLQALHNEPQTVSPGATRTFRSRDVANAILELAAR
jgi:hypothetical protein